MGSTSFFPNSSLSLFPTSSDLLMAFPRLGFSIADFFGFGDVPWLNSSTGNDTSQILAMTTGALNDTLKQEQAQAGSSSALSGVINSLWSAVQRVSNFDGIFSYLWSRWAITTILVAIILNRAHVFASTREPVRSTWKARLLLRIVPVVLLLRQIFIMLETMKCQTGFNLPKIYLKGSETALNKTWVTSTGFLHRATSTLIFWQSTEDSCLAAGMIPPAGSPMEWHGSSTLLWPLFLVLATSQLAETISSALRGQQPRPETGMNIFEHSLAFAEAETVARAAVGIGLFGMPQSPTSTANTTEPIASPTSNPSSQVYTFTRPMLLQKLNVPPEVLLISLISCCSHLSSQVLAICGVQNRFRLVNTGLWGSLFMVLFFYSFINFARPNNFDEIHIIRYPSVCIIGFIPHMITVVGAAVCSLVYALAVFSALLSSPQQWAGLSLSEKLKRAHSNMSASGSWTKVKVSMKDDFYHFLLRIGYQIMMAAAEVVYFNEGLQVTLNPETWLEKARYDEAIQSRRARSNMIPLELHNDFADGDGFGLIDEPPHAGSDGMPLPSGYARERKTMQHLNKSGSAAIKEEGVGVSQRSGRWYMSWKFLEQTTELVGYCAARCTIACWETCTRGQHRPPTWLLEAANIHEPTKKTAAEPGIQQKTLEFWRLTDTGELQAAKDGSDIDVELETRKRLAIEDRKYPSQVEDSALDSHLYRWWKVGGWWGESDSSGDFKPESGEDDFDTTSVISASSSAWETESQSSATSDTTVVPARRRVRSPSVSSASETQVQLLNLARLLDPKSLEQKQEARLLAQRLCATDSHPGVMTRSQYRRGVLQDKLSVLPGSSQSPLLNPDDEALMLQHLITTRRRPAPATQGSGHQGSGQSWREGGAGMGENGPQCAVCHSAPRTVLVWPCRCLSLCEDCRVTLAESNFATCVCCRRDVVAFSRLYVP